MTVAELIKKMVVYSEGNLHDIAHFLKVYAYAKTIGECEHLDENTHLHLRQRRFYMTSLVHCVEKSMAVLTENIRRERAPYWRRISWRVRVFRRRWLDGFPIWWATTIL